MQNGGGSDEYNRGGREKERQLFDDLILLTGMLVIGFGFAGERNRWMGMGNCYPVYRVGMDKQSNAAVVSEKKDQEQPCECLVSMLFQFPAYCTSISGQPVFCFYEPLPAIRTNLRNIRTSGNILIRVLSPG